MKDLEAEDLFEIIGANVKYYRKLYNLKRGKMTQEMLAEKANVSTALIGNLESERIGQGISVYTLWKIAKVLEIPVEKLFDDTDIYNRALDA